MKPYPEIIQYIEDKIIINGRKCQKDNEDHEDHIIFKKSQLHYIIMNDFIDLLDFIKGQIK